MDIIVIMLVMLVIIIVLITSRKESAATRPGGRPLRGHRAAETPQRGGRAAAPSRATPAKTLRNATYRISLLMTEEDEIHTFIMCCAVVSGRSEV